MKQVQEQKKVVDKLLEQEKIREKVDGKDPSYGAPQNKRPQVNIAKLQQDNHEKPKPDVKGPPADRDFAYDRMERKANPKFAKRAEGPYPALR